MKLLLLAPLLGAAIAESAWPDCSPASDGHGLNGPNVTAGPYGPVSVTTYEWKGRPMVVMLPEKAPVAAPLVVFMHGITAEIGMYEANLLGYASQGFVVVFPYIRGPQRDKLPITTNTNGEFIVRGVEFAKAQNKNSSSELFGKIDVENIVLAGHSMGATDSIMAGTKLGPEDGVKLVVTQHPGLCGPFGPPPWPSTWMQSDLSNVMGKVPLLFTTASNDGAFLPAPLTAEHEQGCFKKAFAKNSSRVPHPAIFVEFSKSACLRTNRTKYDDSGHDCPFKAEVETPWVVTMMKLYAHQGGRKDSKCANMLFGREDAFALAKDAHVADLLMHHSPLEHRSGHMMYV
eukprot:TRINITY_DN2737_c0_g3_i1.p1 TRINITY_DN2737_c0_g3~~TRINITY_DN2737_c0_g3_i1.p1  ORF type:complete len:345 (+),score=55.79 TRINITY_DN2737_c0_g3_i1:96-1130(+)